MGISKEHYEMMQKMANKFAYGNTESLLYDLYVSVGLEALLKAYDTYKEGSEVKLTTYIYRCVMNALINEKNRIARQSLQQDENYVLENYDGEVIELRDGNMLEDAKRLILKAVNNNERNAQIVELHIGLNCDKKMELKELAKMFNLTHESVRLVCNKAIKSLQTDKRASELLHSYVG